MSKTSKAAALRYDTDLPAPFLIAKGSGRLAETILSLAEEFDVPIYSKSDLADLLFDLDIGEMIPEDIYEIVAIILSHVYGIQEQI